MLERAYAAGDHRTARRLAHEILQTSDAPLAGDGEREGAAARASCSARAQRVLAETTPDFFLPGIGAAGLGLVTWLVYNYML